MLLTVSGFFHNRVCFDRDDVALVLLLGAVVALVSLVLVIYWGIWSVQVNNELQNYKDMDRLRELDEERPYRRFRRRR